MRLRILAACLAAAAVAPTLAPAGAGAGVSAPAGRQSRTSDIAIAGGDVYIWSSHQPETTGSGCTVSFAVKSVRTGARGVLTAGHCVATLAGGPAYLVHQTQRLAGDHTAPGDLLGRVTGSNYRLNETQGDSAFVQLAPHVTTVPLVFTGGPLSHATMPVAGLGQLQPGTKVCYSGAATGEHCGFTVIGGSQTVSFMSSSNKNKVMIGPEWRASGATCTSRKGDSGSPVYTRVGGVAYAVGILSGGQARANTCPFYFTPVRLALRQYGLKLIKTASPTSS